MTELDLSGLKDIHIPVRPDFFPLAPGWTIMLIVLALIIILGGFLCYYFRFSSKYYAKRLLKTLYQTTPDTREFATQISLLFKRIALSRYPREQVAALSDHEWATFMKQVGSQALSADLATFIAQAAYLPPAKSVAFSTKQVYTAANKWIDIVFKGAPYVRKRRK